VTVVAIVAGVAASLFVWDRNSAPSISTPMKKGKPQVAPPNPKSVKFTPAESAVVLPLAQRFVRDAVARHDMHSAWDISSPELKVDTRRSDWDRGENTIVPPYPVDHARWAVDYSYRNRVGLEVAVFPKAKANVGAMVFYMEVKRRTAHSKWLVDQWVPSQGSEFVVQGNKDPNMIDRTVGNPAGLGAIWLLVPVGLVGLILAIPVALGIRELRRNRRARRKYESTLPPLSPYRQS
jgi:hypothetical protein